MIWESSYWKQDLLRLSGRIAKLSKQKNWSERDAVSFEKAVFIGFYSIRKLIEAKRLSRDIRATRVDASSFPSFGEGVTYMNWHHLDKLYDFSQKQHESLGLEFLCNQVIHSYVFTVIHEDDETVGGVLVSSDRMRNKKLFEVNTSEILRILRAVGHDYPSDGHFTFNEATRDFDIDLFTPKLAKDSVPNSCV